MNEVQPKSVRVLKIPDYFSEYRDKGDGLAAFLGGSIVAKVRHFEGRIQCCTDKVVRLQIAFHDSQGKNYVSKADYSEKGPKAVIEMSPCLL
jgi:actin-related protein 9